MENTAVEWLYNKFSTCTSDEMVGNINNWFEQAKAIEKEQIIKSVEDAQSTDFYVKYYDAEQYYNETFKKK